MKLRDYLKYKRNLIVFYIIHMTFIYGMVIFDRTNRMLPFNAIYMFIVATMMFIFYLLLGFLSRKAYYNNIEGLSNVNQKDLVVSLPKPKTSIDRLYHDLLVKQDKLFKYELESYGEKAKEDLEFITVWVHEIKTPIAVARLIIENTLQGRKDEDCEKSLVSIEEEVDRIEDYVQKALYYIRLNDFSKDYYICSIDIERLVKECIKRHSKSFINKKIKIELEELQGEVSTDKKWMSFILDQIIQNSIKYTKSGGTVRIYKTENEKEKKLGICDTGIGIKEEDVKRLFSKSFTGINGREQYGSTGMGLYLSQKMAKKLGHYITVKSKVKEGTEFTIHFPRWADYFSEVEKEQTSVSHDFNLQL